MRSLLNWFEKHNKLSWFITILIAIIIFYVSSLVFPITPPIGINWKPILYHFYAFLFLAGFLLISITKGKNKKLIKLSIIIALIYAISDEFHQLFVPGRNCGIFDILLDLMGILFATLIYILLRYDKFTVNQKPF
tara:strand:- start:1535 stop:1939 length:405 start_codon:yes stop_codon:yes gene_type:complete